MGRNSRVHKGDRTHKMLPVSKKLNAVLSKLGDGEKQMEVRLWQNWNMVMGPELASLALPLGIRQEILLVGGEDNAALQELTFLKPEILERANAFMDAPVFTKVEIHLVMGKRTLEHSPDIQPSIRHRPSPPKPGDLGRHLAEMREDSPVTRCYAAYLRMHGIL